MSQRDLIVAGVFSAVVFLGVMFVSFGDNGGTGPAAGVNRFLSQIVSFTVIRECSDGLDNDNDGAIDYPADYSCSSVKDNNEQDPFAVCFDGLDNDDDGLVDMADAGCSGVQDMTEENDTQCSDLADNDGDDLIDMNDRGCSSPSDNNESNVITTTTRIPLTHCSDLIDNDLDGWVDLADIGCSGPTDNNETNPLPPQCNDNLDNDGDSFVDMNDPGCGGATDNDEFNATISGSVLDPGPGFTAPTAQPTAMGNSSQQGFDATPIAHWDVVPHQTISGSINIGVLAYHFNNIAYVDFSVDNGPWARVTQESRNPQTDAVEYWVTLRASDFEDDGQVEVRAIVYPNVGQPKVLQGEVVSNGSSSLFLNVNANGTMPHPIRYVKTSGNDNNTCATESQACRTILRAMASAQTTVGGLPGSVDGAEIRLGPGDWQLPRIPGGIFDGRSWVPSYRTNTQWFTITSAPSTDKDHVFITGIDNINNANGDWGLGIEHIRITDVSVVGNIDKAVGGDYYNSYLWFDDNKMFYRDPQILYRNGCGAFHGAGNPWANSFYTDLWMDNVCDGPKDAGFVRNVYVETSGSGHASGAETVINYTVKNILGSGYPFPWGQGPDYHSDVYQFEGRRGDAILYNLRTLRSGFIYSRGIVGYMNNDIAIVDSFIDTTPSHPGAQSGWAFSVCSPVNHLVIKNSTFRGSSSPWCGESSNQQFNANQMRNILIDHSVWENGTSERLVYPWNLPGIRYVPAR